MNIYCKIICSFRGRYENIIYYKWGAEAEEEGGAEAEEEGGVEEEEEAGVEEEEEEGSWGEIEGVERLVSRDRS